MKISRRKLLGTTAAAGVISGGLAIRHYRNAYPEGSIGNQNQLVDVLASLRKTVSADLQPASINEFARHARANFGWVFHPLTSKEAFDRTLCTEFLMNSNLIENGFDISNYEFSEYPGACSPFLYL